MGDNIHLGDRDGVRTPMQWSPDRNGGFSPRRSRRPGAAADHGPALRLPGGQRGGAGARPAFAAELDAADAGGAQALSAASAAARCASSIPATARCWPICASTHRHGEETVLCVCNLSRTPQAVELDLCELHRPGAGGCGRRLGVPADRPAALSADPAALRLLLVPARHRGGTAGWQSPRAGADAGVRARSCCAPASPRCWRRASRGIIEREALPAYLAKRRWFASKGENASQGVAPRLCAAAAGRGRRAPRRDRGAALPGRTRTLRPAARPSPGRTPSSSPLAAAAGARARAPRPAGRHADRRASPSTRLPAAVLAQLARQRRGRARRGRDRVPPDLADWPSLDLPDAARDPSALGRAVEQLADLGDSVVLKIVRRVSAGIHPEGEMTRYLTERGFANTAPLLRRGGARRRRTARRTR